MNFHLGYDHSYLFLANGMTLCCVAFQVNDVQGLNH